MKTSLANLPENKQGELEKVTGLIREKGENVEMIILFGSYARGDFKMEKDLDPRKKSGYQPSDYDILVVTKDKAAALNHKLWREVREACEEEGVATPVRIVTHDIEALNIKLAEAQYFFTDATKEGISLYDSGKFELAEARELSPEERTRIAKDYFEEWMGKAKNFFIDFKNALEREDLKNAAFHLHQTAKISYKTVLLVFTNYSPAEHFLLELKRQAMNQVPELEKILPYRTKEEERLFKLLDYAYIGARYDSDFHIFEDELKILAAEVEKVLDVVERACGAEVGGK